MLDSTTGIRKLQALSNRVWIYPNPFSNSALISFSGLARSGDYTFALYDILGQKVRRIENINTQQIEIKRGNLPNGLYIYKVTGKTNNIIGAGKLVIE